MSTATRNVITATAAICKMNSDERETLLLTIMESNPTSVITAMKLNGVSFKEPTSPNALYKVICDGKQTNKIGLIKEFRTITGAGLADAKHWSEGNTYNGLEAGVLAHGLTKEQADRTAAEINHRAEHGGTMNGYQFSPTYIRVKVVKQDESTDYRTNWSMEFA